MFRLELLAITANESQPFEYHELGVHLGELPATMRGQESRAESLQPAIECAVVVEHETDEFGEFE